MKSLNRCLIAAALAVGLLPSPVAAQEGLRSASLPERNLRSPNPSAPVDLYRAGPRTYAPPVPRLPRDRRRQRFAHDLGFFPYRPFFAPSWPFGAFEIPLEQEPGYLLPRVTPGTAAVVVDDLYVGSVDDVRRLGTGYPLEPGPHRLELRAPGYEPVTVGVVIAPGETNGYQMDLEETPRQAPPPRPAATPKTFYVIPGCYAGDKPPQADRLAPTCDAAKVRMIPPQVSSVRVSK